jgi:hypothetical protein
MNESIVNKELFNELMSLKKLGKFQNQIATLIKDILSLIDDSTKKQYISDKVFVELSGGFIQIDNSVKEKGSFHKSLDMLRFIILSNYKEVTDGFIKDKSLKKDKSKQNTGPISWKSFWQGVVGDDHPLENDARRLNKDIQQRDNNYFIRNFLNELLENKNNEFDTLIDNVIDDLKYNINERDKSICKIRRIVKERFTRNFYMYGWYTAVSPPHCEYSFCSQIDDSNNGRIFVVSLEEDGFPNEFCIPLVTLTHDYDKLGKFYKQCCKYKKSQYSNKGYC